MSNYIKLSTLEYPRHEGDIRLEHPEITEDQTGDTFPCPDTYALVQETSMPSFNPDIQTCFGGAPIQENGVWKMTWIVRNLTPEEIQAKADWLAPK